MWPTLMSHSPRVPLQIWKYVKMGILFSEMLLTLPCHVVIPKRYSIRQPARFSLHSCLSCTDRAYGCRDIRPRLHPYSARFAVSAHLTLDISCAKARGKDLSCSSCHALVMHPSDPAWTHYTPLACQLCRVKISALYSQQFRLQVAYIDPTARWRTDRQKDRQTDRQTDRRTPRNLVN